MAARSRRQPRSDRSDDQGEGRFAVNPNIEMVDLDVRQTRHRTYQAPLNPQGKKWSQVAAGAERTRASSSNEQIDSEEFDEITRKMLLSVLPNVQLSSASEGYGATTPDVTE